MSLCSHIFVNFIALMVNISHKYNVLTRFKSGFFCKFAGFGMASERERERVRGAYSLYFAVFAIVIFSLNLYRFHGIVISQRHGFFRFGKSIFITVNS